MRRLICAFAALGAFALTAPGLAAKKAAPAENHAFDLDHLLTLSSIGDPVWSRDGRRVAFVVTASDTAENTNNNDLWMVDLVASGDGGPGKPLRLTRHPKADTSPTFSPSGDTLAFIANRGTGDDAKSAIWMMSLRGGEPWAFGTYDDAVTEVAWSPDGRWLAYVKLDTLPKRVNEWKKKKWDHVIEDERLQYPAMWIVDLSAPAGSAGAKPRRITSGQQYVWNLRWSPDSKRIAWLVSPTGKPDDSLLADIGVAEAASGAAKKLGVVGAGFAWSPDSKWIAWASGPDRTTHVYKTDLRVISASGGTPLNLTANFDEDAATPAWSADGETLYFWSEQGVTTRLAAVPRSGGPVTLGLDVRGQTGTLVRAGDGHIAWVQSQAMQPSELWIADGAGRAGRVATAFNASTAGLILGTTRAVQWTSSDGAQVEGLLLRPPNAPAAAALKTLVLLHGGPYTTRYALGFESGAQYFAAHGYQVFMPNFRSSGGYGTAFMMRKRSDWGFQDWADVTSGVDFLVREGLADSRKLGVYGGSYGGYLSAWAITHTDRFKAAAVLAGAVDLAAHYGQSDIQKYRAFDFGGPPWETPENWRRSSPMTYIQNAKTPTLILIGEADQRVPYPQAQELYRALTALQVPTEFVHYPREGHGLREPRHRADQFTRMLGWFDRWIR